MSKDAVCRGKRTWMSEIPCVVEQRRAYICESGNIFRCRHVRGLWCKRQCSRCPNVTSNDSTSPLQRLGV